MFRNVLAATLGNLARNRLYAAISIGGLAVGMAAAILTGLYVRGATIQQGRLLDLLCAVAVMLAGLGLFGLASFTVERRTKEIGVRKAMGASKADVTRLLLWSFSRPVLWANLIAWPLTWQALQVWLEGFSRHIDLQPWMFLVSAAAALLIALATVLAHTLRVAAAKPVRALRYE
jgi:putative ABC transport system permease protein